MMSAPVLELEGTWEEILEHATELRGMHVTLKAVPEEEKIANGDKPLTAKQKRMLKTYKMLMEQELTVEEKRILDEFPEFRRKHPFDLRRPEIDALDWSDHEK